MFISVPFCLAGQGQGGLPGAFLRTGAGARAWGMGRTFTAVSDDAATGYWNPAGSADLERFEIHGTYSSLSLDRANNYISAIIPVSKKVNPIGISWLSYSIDDIEGRDFTGRITETFEKSQNAFFLSHGISISKKLYLGINYKYFLHHLYNNNASGFGYDFGILLSPSPKLRFGAVIQDISSHLKWNTDSKIKETIPRVARAGISFIPFKYPVLFCADYEKIQYNYGTLHFGCEMNIIKYLSLRAGFNDEDFTIGGSLKIPNYYYDLQLDYCFIKDPIDQSYNHRFSVNIKFRKKGYYNIIKESTLDRDDSNRIIRIMTEMPNSAVVINHNNLLHENMHVEIFRKTQRLNNILIGTAKVVMAANKASGLEIMNLEKGFDLKIGDYLLPSNALVIKIIDYKAKTMLVNKGKNEGIIENKQYKIFRDIKPVKGGFIKIGNANVVKSDGEFVTIQILNLIKGFQLLPGDIIIK
jgi:hypothetical protein